MFEPQTEDSEEKPSAKVEEEKEPGDFGNNGGGEQALKANQERLFPLEVRHASSSPEAGSSTTYDKIEKRPKHFEWEILLDHKYPFSQPQAFCLTRVTNHIDLYDGRDLYTEILNGEEWRVARNLHEIIACIPEFIETTKQAEDEALEKKEIEDAKNLLSTSKAEDDPILTEVYGRYLLENIYDLSEF